MKPVNKEILKDEILWLMEAISEQTSAIISYEGKIPRIEFDIIMENVRKFYESLNILQRSEDPAAFIEEAVREIPVVKTMVPGKNMAEQEPEPELESEPEEEPVPEIRPDLPDSVPGISEAGAKEGTGERKSAKPKHAEDYSEVNLFSDAGSGFTEKLKEAREKSFGPRSPKSDDLKASISINEKFLIINELFSGNLRDYNEMIDTLNGYQDLRTALEYLDLLRRKNIWDTGSGVFVRLKELVEKRFG